MQLRRAQRGDTIIEVLIAIAIASSVLGGVFAFSNRAAKNIQQSHEHTEALRLAESYVERLKDYVDRGNALPSVGTEFCFNDATGAYQANQRCTITVNSSVSYRIWAVGQTPESGSAQGGRVYIVTTEWDAITEGTDSVQVAYKAYP